MPNPKQRKHFYDFGPFRLDIVGRQLFRSGHLIPLTPKAFDVLAVLVENAGTVVGKTILLNAVWPGVSVEEGILSVNIAAVRKALSDEDGASAYIETVPRHGYKLVADVREVRAKRRAGHRVLAFALGAAAVAVIGICIWRWMPSTVSPAPLRAWPLTSYAGKEMNPSFSPDGSQVTFSWSGEKDDNYDIYVKLLDAESALRLTRDPAPDTSPAWSPDGRQIAFVRNRGVFLISPLGSPERRLAEVDAGHLAWTPDGRSIAANSGRQGIVLISTDTGEIRPLTTPPASAAMGDLLFAFSPSGKNLAFARFSTAMTADLYLLTDPLSSPTPHERQVLTLGQGIYGLTWTADERELVYASGRTSFQAGLFRLPIYETAAKPLLGIGEGVTGPAIWLGRSGIKSKLAFERRRINQNIWKIDNLGTPHAAGTRIVASTQRDMHPQISPDGRRVAFISDRTGTFQVWICDLDGSNLAQVTFMNDDYVFSNAPRWSPDGAFIAFAAMAKGNRDIYVVPVGGGRVRRFTEEASEEGRPGWSADGQWIYFYSTKSGTFEIWKKAVDGSHTFQVTQGGGHEAFESLDGRHLYVEKPHGRGLWTVSPNLEKQNPRPVPGLEAVSASFWALTDSGIYFLDLGQQSVIDRRYDPLAIIMSLASLSVPSRMPMRFLSFRTGHISDVMSIEAIVDHSNGGFHVARNAKSAVWAQIDSSESDLLIVDHFQ